MDHINSFSSFLMIDQKQKLVFNESIQGEENNNIAVNLIFIHFINLFPKQGHI